VLVFDGWSDHEEAYVPEERFLLAAMEVDLDCPAFRLEPRGLPVPTGERLAEALTESAAFNGRYHLRCADRRFATELVDQRLMAWLLERPRAVSLQAGGRWLAVVAREPVSASSLNDLVAGIVGFRRHVPRVLASLHPAVDAAFDRTDGTGR
jgi:hypothetical protein